MRLIDADKLILYLNDYALQTAPFRGERAEAYNAIKQCIEAVEEQQTAYDIDKVVEELEETMQDLSVIEILSHIDFDNTIQIGLDNFLKSYNSELLRIVKQGGVTDDACEWRLCDEEANVYDTSCRNPHILVEGTPKENNYEYCPYCGKKNITRRLMIG